jgi:PAS domain S-box-containing protein
MYQSPLRASSAMPPLPPYNIPPVRAARTFRQLCRMAAVAVLLFAGAGARSQAPSVWRNERLDSLLNILPLTSGRDRLDLLSHLVHEYHHYRPVESLPYAREALDLAMEQPDESTRAEAERAYGMALLMQNQHREALDWLFRSAETAASRADMPALGRAYGSIGLAYARIRYWQKALEHYRKALEIAAPTADAGLGGWIHSNAGESYLHLGQTAEALSMLLRADSLMQDGSAGEWLALNLNRLAEYYLHTGQPGRALPYAERAMTFARQKGQTAAYTRALCLFADSQLQTGNYTRAEQYGLEAADVARELQDLALQAYSHRILAGVYRANEDLPRAFQYQSSLLALKDSLHNLEDFGLIGQLSYAEELLVQNQVNRQLRNEMQRQEALNTANRTVIRQQRNTVIAVTFSLLLAAASTFVLYRLRQKERRSNRELLLRNQELARSKKELTSTLQMVETLNSQFEAQNKALNHVAIVSITDLEGNIVRVNKAFEEVSGYSSDELIGNRHNLVRSSYHSKSFFDHLWTTVAEGKTWRGEICNRNKQGKLYWCDTAITPILNENEQPKQYFSIQFEITERKRYEKMLKEQASELLTLNKLKDKLFSLVSHDFRSPLRSLKGILSLYQDGTIDNREMRNLTASLLLRLDSTSNMLDNLLQWARSQMQGLKVQGQEIEVQPALTETLEVLKTNLEKKEIGIHTQIESGVRVFADGEMLRLVLRNLISNAIKFSRQGSGIEIRVESNGKQVQFAIRDQGVGIDEETQKKLFSLEVFSSPGTANETGIGIGLVLCKDFVERNHGKIWVESVQYEGSTFYFTLPAAPFSQAGPAAETTPPGE